MRIDGLFGSCIDISEDQAVVRVETSYGNRRTKAYLLPNQLKEVIEALVDVYGRDIYLDEIEYELARGGMKTYGGEAES